MTRHWERLSGEAPQRQGWWFSDPMRAHVSVDDGRWHMSVSTLERYPTWDEIADARYDLLPGDLDFALILPPMEDYVNLQGSGVPHVFHLWQIEDRHLPIDRGYGMPRTRESGLVV